MEQLQLPGMMTQEEVGLFLNKYCEILWPGGGMEGLVIEVKGGWLLVGYGYGVRISDITRIRCLI